MRILSKTLKVFFPALALGAAALFAADAIAPLQSLLNAETAFAQMAVEHGTRDAFLANLSDDAVIFEPGPVNGKKVWLKREPASSRLLWQPLFADIARAGDIGYTTGPWEFRKNASDPKASAYGQFLSIWKKGSDGIWKVILDGGIETPRPTGKISTSELPQAEPPAETNLDVKSYRRALAAAERDFSDASEKDAGAALIAAASNSIRVFRSGRFPALGRDAAQLMLGYDHGRMKTKRAGGGISRSGDLGYTYGDYTNKRPDGAEQGSYLTIWKATVGGDWRLVVDARMQRPAPEKKPD